MSSSNPAPGSDGAMETAWKTNKPVLGVCREGLPRAQHGSMSSPICFSWGCCIRLGHPRHWAPLQHPPRVARWHSVTFYVQQSSTGLQHVSPQGVISAACPSLRVLMGLHLYHANRGKPFSDSSHALWYCRVACAQGCQGCSLTLGFTITCGTPRCP